MDSIESKRIVEITDEPVVTDEDYFVIDGKKGTRKVPTSNFLVKSGPDVPAEDYGVQGMLYLKMSGTSISAVYFKVNSTDWVQILPGGYTPVSTSLSELTWEQIGHLTWGEIANYTW